MDDEKREEVAARREELKPRCEHGVLRATAQFIAFAGPVSVCGCCRSHYGYLGKKPDPDLCPRCRYG